MSLLGYLHVYQTSSHKMLGLCTQSTTTVSTEMGENKKRKRERKSGTRESAKKSRRKLSTKWLYVRTNWHCPSPAKSVHLQAGSDSTCRHADRSRRKLTWVGGWVCVAKVCLMCTNNSRPRAEWTVSGSEWRAPARPVDPAYYAHT